MTHTPAMSQFYELKKQYPDCILFFRMGDFYEMFDDDALIANKILGIAVTSRNKNAEKSTPLAWFPYHAKDKYLPLLVAAWYKVAIAEQVSDPKLKWIVNREVVRVVTPATISLEWDMWLQKLESEVLIAIIKKDELFAMSVLDLANNKWHCWEFHNFALLKAELFKLAPREVVLAKDLFNDKELKEVLEKKYQLNIFFYEEPKKFKKILLDHFWVINLHGFGIENSDVLQRVNALLLEYLQNNQKTSVWFLDKLSIYESSNHLEVDEASIKSLDLVYNFSTQSSHQGTLLWVLDQTQTIMWKKVLRDQILKPLKDKSEIEKRQKFIEEFISNKPLLETLSSQLAQVSNIQSILNRLAVGRAFPKDLLQLKKSLIAIKEIFHTIETMGSRELKDLI